jgi:hypothetical protein
MAVMAFRRESPRSITPTSSPIRPTHGLGIVSLSSRLSGLGLLAAG